MSHPAPIRHAEAVMGTVVSFVVHPGSAPPAGVSAGIGSACASLRRDEATFSTWRPDSPMSRLRRGELQPTEIPAVVTEVLALCTQASDLTGGWFDPWSMAGGVDPTGLVKGWAAHRALRLLAQAGAQAAMVNAGGDIACFGRPPGSAAWRVGIRHPWQPAAFACVIQPAAAVATSGNYERPGQLIDPRTGGVSTATASATVTGPELSIADALATGLAVGGAPVLDLIEAAGGYEAYLVTSRGAEATTSGFEMVPAA